MVTAAMAVANNAIIPGSRFVARKSFFEPKEKFSPEVPTIAFYSAADLSFDFDLVESLPQIDVSSSSDKDNFFDLEKTIVFHPRKAFLKAL